MPGVLLLCGGENLDRPGTVPEEKMAGGLEKKELDKNRAQAH